MKTTYTNEQLQEAIYTVDTVLDKTYRASKAFVTLARAFLANLSDGQLPTEKPADEIPWTEWHGDECPLDDDEVEEWEFKCRDGGVYSWKPVSERLWDHDGGPSDIIAYRVLKWKKPDLYAELKKAHADGKMIEAFDGIYWVETTTPAWISGPENYRIKPDPETFQAHGKTWTHHTPGDPMPCDGEVKIYCIGNTKGVTHGAYPANWWAWSKQSCIIGWRYADEPKQNLVPDQTKDVWTPQVGEVVRLKSGGPLMTVGKVSDEAEIFCFRGDDLMKTSIPTACLELSTKEDAR